VFRLRYAPLGFVAWLIAKRKLRALAARAGLTMLAAGAAVAAAMVTRRLVRPLVAPRTTGQPPVTIRLGYEEDEWVLRRDGDEDPVERHRTKAEAEKAARALAQREHAELVVYTRDGELQRQQSYAA
jgi:hypothetical protein